MRIAQIAPLAESVPPKLYGGTERVVHWLTEELIALGHEVTLFASGEFGYARQAGAGNPQGPATGQGEARSIRCMRRLARRCGGNGRRSST